MRGEAARFSAGRGGATVDGDVGHQPTGGADGRGDEMKHCKFLALLCAKTMPQKSQRIYDRKHIFFLAQTTLKKIEKIDF